MQTERRCAYLSLLAMIAAPFVGIPLILIACSAFHGCAPSQTKQQPSEPLPHGASLFWQDDSLNSDANFHVACLDPATHAFGRADPAIYRATPASTAAEVRAEIRRELACWVNAYPRAVNVNVRRYRGGWLSGRTEQTNQIFLGWFIRDGQVVVADCSWEFSRLYWRLDDGSSLPVTDQARQDAARAALAAPGGF